MREEQVGAVEKLKAVLSQNREILQKLEEAESNLQDLLVQGKAVEIQEIDDYRRQLQGEIERLEERRKQIVPAGSSVRQYIRDNASPEDREEMLQLLESITGLLYSLQARQEVNWSLLRERRRHSREVLDTLAPSETTYDGSGQVRRADGRSSLNINRSC